MQPSYLLLSESDWITSRHGDKKVRAPNQYRFKENKRHLTNLRDKMNLYTTQSYSLLPRDDGGFEARHAAETSVETSKYENNHRVY